MSRIQTDIILSDQHWLCFAESGDRQGKPVFSFKGFRANWGRKKTVHDPWETIQAGKRQVGYVFMLNT